MSNISLPSLLQLPPPCLPIITQINSYRYLLLEGGRGSGKSQSVARLLLYIADQKVTRIVCGREIQNNIEESVHAILKDLIDEYDLPYDVLAKEIRHKTNGSVFRFKGFREQGRVNIKGLEGVDILWIDEAQSITSTTLKDITPTIRKDSARIMFTMNRYTYDDAVPNFFAGLENSLHIKVNYNENPYCPASLKVEAENMRARSERDYRHIWLGEPLASSDDYLFNQEHLRKSYDIQVVKGTEVNRQRVMGIDFAAQGQDQCVAVILDRVTSTTWEIVDKIAWDEDDAMVSVGRIVNLMGMYKPDVAVLDVGGMGTVVHARLMEVGMDIKRFDGATVQGVNKVDYVNARAEGYYLLKDWFEKGWLKVDRKYSDMVKQLEKIRMKFRSDGRRLIQSKVEMKKQLGRSPDDADGLMMAVWAAVKYLDGGASITGGSSRGRVIKRVTGSTRGGMIKRGSINRR